MSALSMALAMDVGNKQAALAKLGTYESRGHGRNKYSGKKRGNACTNWKAKLNGQTCGQRECARRIYQAARNAGFAV